MSTVRRPSSQRAYLREASKLTTVLRLHGVPCHFPPSWPSESLLSLFQAFFSLGRYHVQKKQYANSLKALHGTEIRFAFWFLISPTWRVQTCLLLKHCCESSVFWLPRKSSLYSVDFPWNPLLESPWKALMSLDQKGLNCLPLSARPWSVSRKVWHYEGSNLRIIQGQRMHT